MITLAEVEDIEGEKGRFTVRVRKTPRFIDPYKCTGCGECIAVCPIELPSEHDAGLALRKAIYIPYSQTIPGSYAITKKGTAPCRATCASHASVQGFIALTREGRYQEALELFKRDHPFPGVCGRVCDHPCEDGCSRNSVDQPLRIMDIHRFLADMDMADGKPHVPAQKAPREEKIAIVGAGPAGLTCAYFLAIEGYRVTVFEKLDVLGGMLAVGIPAYRLPRHVTEAEIRVIRELGVEFRTGVEIGKDVTIGELRRQGFKAFFIGIGAHDCRYLNIEGEDCDGVYPGVEYLRRINLGGHIPLGDRVAVIGGGNVAMDAVRTALREGAKKPFIIYRRSVDQMPTHAEEIEECRQEGIEMMTLTNPTRVIAENGRVCAIECQRMELGPPDESGRRRPLPVKGSEFVLEVDSVIPAVGQEIDWTCLTDDCACSLSDRKTLEADPVTLQTADPDIFAGGDAVTGPSTVVAAVGAGKQAAISIDRFVRREDLYEGRDRQWTVADDVDTGQAAVTERSPMPLLDPETRINNFSEVRLGLDKEAVHVEANRCLQCGGCCECYQCVSACRAEAVTIETHRQQSSTLTLEAGAVILNPGFKPFDPTGIDFYGYKRIPDIVTSLEYERMLAAGGPFQGHIRKPSNGMAPKSVAWIQCVGSRNINTCDNSYCSSVCCMYAMKQALITDAHLPEGSGHTIFFVDMRCHGKEFELYYQYAREQNIRFIRARPHTIHPGPDNCGVCLVYVTEDGSRVVEQFDMTVLSVGMEAPPDAADIAERIGIELNRHRFAKTNGFNPALSTRDGVYISGSFAGPMNIPTSVVQASSAAAAAAGSLAPARNTLTREKKYPPEKDVSEQAPRIGVFVCSCGVNIANTIDVKGLVEYALSIPGVVFAENNMFTCSTDTQNMMTRAIEENGLNRIVVAACSPRTHEPLFQDTLKEAGLNGYLLEMANIRNHNAWVHQNESQRAFEKAKTQVRMAVERVRRAYPLSDLPVDVIQKALVVGGGPAGLSAALNLADQGCETVLVEKTGRLGGNALNIRKNAGGGEESDSLGDLIDQVESRDNIRVFTNARLISAEGTVGSFSSKVEANGGIETIEYGAAVLATGGRESVPEEYRYGHDERVMTHLEFDKKLTDPDSDPARAGSVVFIQCVGSRDEKRNYCSRICCTHTMKSAIELKERNPGQNVYVLYRDIRTYGTCEEFYTRARQLGVVFIRYQPENKPSVFREDGRLMVQAAAPILGKQVVIETDYLVLAAAIEPNDVSDLVGIFRCATNQDGFLNEAHPKLRPVDMSVDGLFIAGLCNYPKMIEEAVSQGAAAASRAGVILSRDRMYLDAVKSFVTEQCDGCALCVDVCPYDAISVAEERVNGYLVKRARTEPSLCKGCGACEATCPKQGIEVHGFTMEQLRSQVHAALEAVN